MSEMASALRVVLLGHGRPWSVDRSGPQTIETAAVYVRSKDIEAHALDLDPAQNRVGRPRHQGYESIRAADNVKTIAVYVYSLLTSSATLRHRLLSTTLVQSLS